MKDKKIVDFVHSNQFANTNAPISKGIQVSFKLPSNLQYDFNGNKVEVGLGIVMEHSEDGKYTINYKNENITIKSTDIYATKLQLEKWNLIGDSVISTNVIELGNTNDLINMKNRLLPELSEEEFKTLSESINELADDGTFVVCYLSEESISEELQPGKIASYPYGKVFFNAHIE